MVCSEEVCDLTPIRIPHDIKHVFRPYLHVFAHSNELEETGIVSLSGVNVESDPFKESLLGVCGITFCLLFAC